MQKKIVRQIRFCPEMESESDQARFILTVWNTGEYRLHRKVLGYSFIYKMNDEAPGIMIFRAEDFGCPIEKDSASDETIMALVEFLTCDLDCLEEGRLKEYTEDQKTFSRAYGASVLCSAEEMFYNNAYSENLYD